MRPRPPATARAPSRPRHQQGRSVESIAHNSIASYIYTMPKMTGSPDELLKLDNQLFEQMRKLLGRK